MTDTIKTIILGASGYTGAELLRWLPHHPHINVVALSGDSQAGKPIGSVYPHLRNLPLPALQKIKEIDFSAVDLVFCCLPHGTTQEVIAELLGNSLTDPTGSAQSGRDLGGKAPQSKIKIIDLSADFRLRDPEVYAQWYGKPHQAEALQKQAVYGLTEIHREAIKTAQLVANPGCYPTAAQLPLIPLLKAGLIQPQNIVIDAKSGVTGAGRKLAQNLLYCEVTDNFSAYGIASHRHIPEIEQGLNEACNLSSCGEHGESAASQTAGDSAESNASQNDVKVRFTPHLVPMGRGILSTIYVDLTPGKTATSLRAELQRVYGDEPFVHILPEGEAPSTAQVKGTNDCLIAVFADRIAGKAIVISAIDNLAKGSSSQALHNMNLMFGLPETTGLAAVALFP